jgi:microcystin-dependent protein
MAAKLQTMRSGGTQHPEEIVNFMMSQLVSVPGVYDLAASKLLVTQETVPAMSVKVAQGAAFLKASGANMAYPGFLTDADASVAISSNSSGNPRKDAIVLYVDKGATPNADITNVLKLIAVDGTPAGSPVSPSDATIQAAIGSANPFLRLADVTVASGAVSILNANILDTRVEMKLKIQIADPTLAQQAASKNYVDGLAGVHAASAKTTPVDADEFGLFDSAAAWVLKKLSFLNLKLAITDWNNPIGTIRSFNVSTNPATLLGIGTWAAHGTGRVTVAIDAGQTEFDVLGETGGEKTHLLTGSESGEKGHGHSDSGHGHNVQVISTNVWWNNGGTAYGTGTQYRLTPDVASGGQLVAATGYANISSVAAANASAAHNNLQPYIVVYRWVRTA